MGRMGTTGHDTRSVAESGPSEEQAKREQAIRRGEEAEAGWADEVEPVDDNVDGWCAENAYPPEDLEGPPSDGGDPKAYRYEPERQYPTGKPFGMCPQAEQRWTQTDEYNGQWVDADQERAFGRSEAEVARRVAGLSPGQAEPSVVTVTVTIGRNVGSEPMAYEQWGRFKRQLRSALKVNDATVYVRATGEGEWEGRVEQNYTVVASMLEANVPSLRRRLWDEARAFSQDAIALTVGTTYLVGPNA